MNPDAHTQPPQPADHLSDHDPRSMPVDQARRYIRQFLQPVTDEETLPLRDALGRVLAESPLAPHNVPNNDNSAMDGYAFNADDLAPEGETRLAVAATILAGQAFDGRIGRGECARIMTGAIIPAGTDTVIMQERVTATDGAIRFSDRPARARNVRRAGEDLAQGQQVLPRGRCLRPADLGLIASLGLGDVRVYRKLRVAFFSTGDELIGVGQPLRAGQLYDSNRYTLHGMLTRLGVDIIDLGVVRDTPELLEQTLLQAARDADVIITSGGVSVGEADFMKQLLAKLGEVVFWKIAMKPGRPLAFGKVGGAHYFGLPGNPVAVMVTFYQFVREALLVLMGQPEPPPTPLLSAVCTENVKKLAGRTEFQRGVLYPDQDGSWKVRPLANQGSGILRSMSEANCFIVLDESTGNLAAGATVRVQVLEGVI